MERDKKWKEQEKKNQEFQDKRRQQQLIDNKRSAERMVKCQEQEEQMAHLNLKSSTLILDDDHNFVLKPNSQLKPKDLLEDMSEFQKLGALNNHLNNDKFSYQDKIMLIYQSILEEINLGCEHNQKIVSQEEQLDKITQENSKSNQNLQVSKDSVKNVERDITSQMLKNLELRKDADRIRSMNENDNPFELSQEEINQCIMKEDTQQLTESLQFMVSKLQGIKKAKETELAQKNSEASSAQKIVKNSENLKGIRNEAQMQKAKADDQQRHVSQLLEEIEINEIQDKITQQNIDDDSSQMMQQSLILENERKRVQIESNKRYQRLMQVEEQNDSLQQLMAEKSKLIKKRRDANDLIQSMQDKISTLEKK